jgi:hypothetical protein
MFLDKMSKTASSDYMGADTAQYGATDRVRSFASTRFVQPAKRQNVRTFQIHSGTLAKTLVADGLLAPNRYPIVCNALRSRRFLEENHIRLLEERTNAASGQSSDVTFIYALDHKTADHDRKELLARFDTMRGLLKEAYREVGGAEQAINSERDEWGR